MSVDAVAACLDRAEAAQRTLNPYVTLDRDAAMAAARAADALPGARPLRGVPFSAKDNIETAGLRTTYGSRTLEANVPSVDAIAVARMRDAGGVLIGKTTLPEFGSSVLSVSPLTGTTRSPWDLERTPGGSSSGAGASVAAGIEPIALTTDAGASTRLPAAVCGVLGFKPSRGLIPYEQFPDGFGNFIHIGLITRTVANMAVALDVVSGEDPNDPLTIGVAKTRSLEALREQFDLAGRRIAWRPFLGNQALDDEVRAACEATLDVFARRGAAIERVDEPFENAGPTWRTLQFANFAGRFAMPDEATAKLMDPGFLAGAKAGAAFTGKELTAALYKRTSYFRIVQAWFQSFDWVATPVTTTVAVPITHRGDTPLEINGKPAGELRAAWGPYLNLFNLTGHPALSVPAGFTKSGLPIGIQLVGRLQQDTSLLQLAKVVEDDRPWLTRRPAHALD